MAEWRPAAFGPLGDGSDQASESFGYFDEPMGFDVEAGLGCLIDEEHYTAMLAQDKTLLDAWEISVTDSISEDAVASTRALLDLPSGGRMALCSTGWGDGTYGSYFGLNATGTPVVLLVDFQVLQT